MAQLSHRLKFEEFTLNSIAHGLFRRVAEKWVAFSLRHLWLTAAVSLAFTGLALWAASFLSLKTDLATLLPRDYPSVKELDRVQQKVGGLEKVIFVIESPDSAANHRFALALGQKLLADSAYSYVEWSRDLSFFDDHKLLYMDLEDLGEVYRRVSSKVQMDEFGEPLDFSDIEEKYKGTNGSGNNSNGSDGWATADGTTRILIAYPAGQSGDVGFSRKVIASARRQVAALNPASFHPQLEVYYGGEFKNRVDEYESLVSDIKSTAIISILGIIITISLYFRQYFAWLYIGYPLIAGLGWTFGITALTVGHLNLITAFLIAALTGLGIDFGIHVFQRYTEERGRGQDLETATTRAIVNTGSALLTSATTTVVAFYALTITDFKGFSEYGFIAGTGVLMTLTAVLFSFPAFIAIGERLNLVRHRHAAKKWAESTATFPFAKAVVYGTVFLLAIAVFAAAFYPRVRFDYDFSNLRSNIPASNLVKSKISKIQPMESAPAAIVVEDSAARMEVADALRAIQRADTLSPTIKEVRTLEGFVPADQDQKMALIRRLRRVVEGHEEAILEGQSNINVEGLKRWLNVNEITTSDLPDFIVRKFRGPDGSLGEFVVIGTSVSLRDGKQTIAFAEDIREIDTPHFGKFYASGSAVIFADMLLVMQKDSVIATTVTLLVVFAIVLLQFGTKRAALLAILPVLVDGVLVAFSKITGAGFHAKFEELAWVFGAEAVLGALLVFLFERKAFKTTILVMAPLLGGVILMIGTMALTGVRFNFYNIVALPSILGMGVDNGVHFYARYREEGRGSVLYVLRTTGAAALMASLTTMEGFGGMLTADHRGLYSLGLISIIGMGTCLYMSVVFLPAWFAYREERHRKTD